MRGQGSFDQQRLIAALRPFDTGMGGMAGDWDAYREFYQLEWEIERVLERVPDRVLDRSRAREVLHSVGSLVVDEHRVVVQQFAPTEPSGTAVVCHGYYDHVGLYGHLIGYLLSKGLVVIAFDQPGHGLSSGPRASIDDFGRYVRTLRAVLGAATSLPKPWHIVGQSMGASVVLEYLATAEDSPFVEAVLFAPLVRPALWSVNRWLYHAMRNVVTERPRRFTRNAENPEFLELLRRDPLQAQALPVAWVTAMVEWMIRFEQHGVLPINPKIIQGHADQTVGWRYNLKLIREKCDPEVLEIPAARHHLVNESADIRSEMWSWLDERCAWQAPDTKPVSRSDTDDE